MKHRILIAVITGALFAPGIANACSSMEDAMATFEKVKNLYVANAAAMKPEQFPVWTQALQAFGDSMGKQDFASSCNHLNNVAVELGFMTAAAPAETAPAATAPAASTGKAGSGSASGSASESATAATTTTTTTTTTTDVATPQPQPTPQPTPQPVPQPTEVAQAEGGWVECPRGRCRDQY